MLAARRAAAHVFVADLERPALAADDIHHLTRVLRLRPGEAISAADGRGGWRMCRFAPGGELRPDGPTEMIEPDTATLTVGFAPTKGEHPEWTVQKLTECGIDRMVVLRTERTVVRWDPDRAHRQMDRLREVARQAAMQSRRLRLPTVEGPAELREVTAGMQGGPGALALAEPGGAPPWARLRAILVGPEGGWSDTERAEGHSRVSLGTGIFRSETAAVASGVLLTALRGGLVSESRR